MPSAMAKVTGTIDGSLLRQKRGFSRHAGVGAERLKCR